MRFQDIPIRILLVAAFLFSGLLPLMALATFSFSAVRREMHQQAFRQLESVRNIKKSQVERFFRERVAHVESLAADPSVGEAVAAFEGVIGKFDDGIAGHGNGNFTATAAYLLVHDRYFSHFSTTTQKLGYYDLFLMDAKSGFTLFTVKKEADFGVSAKASPGSPLEEVWRISISEKRTAVSDTRPYVPSGVVPAQFIATPIFRNGVVVGVFAAQILLESIDTFMTERPGMGETGEVYLVGPDYRMRSDSYLDPVNHSVNASFRGTIEENGVRTEASCRALKGETGSLEILDYRGQRVLSAFAPVDAHGIRWAIIAEIDAREIDAKISAALDSKVTLILFVSLMLLLFLALSIAGLVSHGVRRVINELEILIGGVLKGNLTARGNPHNVAHDFFGVVEKTNELVAAFSEKTAESDRLEEVVELNQRMESVGMLASGIAHDFKNILNYLYNYGDLVLDRLQEGTQEHAHMVELLSGIDRASNLVERLMAFGRQAKRERQIITVAPLLREVASFLAGTIPKNIEMVTRIDDESASVFADSTQLRQIAMNLCTNALHAMKESGGVMTLFMQVVIEDGSRPGVIAGKYCLIGVSDTGCGIPDDIRAKIFDPFFTTKPQGQGTGMGLAVVQGIVKGYSGAISIDTRVGEGSTFNVFIPLHAPLFQIENAGKAPSLEAGLNGRILVVDDDEETLISLRISLEAMGYEVRTATDGLLAEATVLSASEKIDLVLTDIHMPNLGGIDLVKRLKRMYPDLPIVMMTGSSMPPTDAEVRKLGAERIVLKPFRAPTLGRMIADIIGNRPHKNGDNQ